MSNSLFLTSAVFVAGVLSFFSPCIVPILPVYISIFAKGEGDLKAFKKQYLFRLKGFSINLQIVFKTIVFVLGISTSFVILGFGAGALGSLINTRLFITFCGIIVVILGFYQTGLIHFSFLEREKKLSVERSSRSDILGTFLLGFTFSFGWSPCIGPILATVLSISATHGQSFYGALLMFVYSLGLMIPFLIISLFTDFLIVRIKKINKHLYKLKIVGGIIIIFMGILLMFDNLNLILKLFNK